MSRSWNTWLSRWKALMGPNRRSVRRRPIVTRLRTELLETRVTPAVIFGETLGMPHTSTAGGGSTVTSSQPIDTQPPTITIDPFSSTQTTNLTFTGTITDNNMFGLVMTVSVDKGAYEVLPVSTSGQFTFTTNFSTDGTQDGSHLFIFSGRDAAGNPAVPVKESFTLNTTSNTNGNLTLALDSGSDTGTAGNNKTELSSVTLKGTAPASTTVTLTEPGGGTATTTSDATGAYSFTNVALATGPNAFTVKATSGTSNLTASLTVIRDTAPTVSSPIANFQVSAGVANSVFNMPTVFSDQDVNTILQFTTNRGTFDVELFDQQVGTTVANFLSYVNSGAYNSSIFHRVTNTATSGIAVLQGGGFKLNTSSGTVTLPAIPTNAAITLQDFLTNAAGTIAMARTSAPNTATSQFFFNTAANASLDHSGGADPTGNGYAVFGVILGNGLTTVQASAAVPPVDESLSTDPSRSAFSEIPLSGGFPPNDPAFPGDTSASDYEVITGVSVLSQPIAAAPDSLTFAVSSNTNPTLVTPTITNGKLTLTYASGQTGSSTITLTATDSDGATAQTTFTVTVGDDTTPPTVAVTSPTNGATVKTSPAITGTATDNLAVTSLTASVDGGAAQTVTVNADGTFTFNPNLAVDGTADGSHTVIFTAMDAAGNTSTPASVTFTLDTVAPAVTITSPADGQTFATNPTITGTAIDNLSLAGLTASVDGAAAQNVTVDSQGGFTFTTSLATDGSASGQHTVTFIATDSAGNASPAATLTFTLTVASPAVTLTAPDDGAQSATVPAFTGSVADLSESSSLTASVDGGTPVSVTVDSQGNFSFTPSIATDGSADGTHTVTFAASGPFTAVSRSFVLDTIAPTITVTAPANGQTFSFNPTITGTIVDSGTGLALASASVDGGPPQTLNLDSQGNFSFIPPVASGGSQDGPHTVTFTAKDAVGNLAAPVTFTYNLDTVAPAITITSPPNDVSGKTDPDFVGTVSDSGGVASLTVSINGGAAQSVTFDSQGNFSFDPNLPTDGTADGFYTFSFVARDTAGNQATQDQHYTLDTTPPTVTITSPADGQTFTSNPTIQGSATDNIGSGSANVLVDGTFAGVVTFPTNGTFSFTTHFATDGSANGQHSVTFIALDAAGNQSAPATVTFTLAAQAPSPAVVLTAPIDGQAFNTNPAFTGSVSDLSEAGNLTASVDGGAPQTVTVDSQGNFSFTPNVPTDGSADGTHTVTFSAGGQFSDVSRSFVLDTTAPLVIINSPADGQTFNTNPTIQGKATDNIGITSMNVFVDGNLAGTVTVASDGTFSFTTNFATDGTANGPHTVSFVALDDAGNQSNPATLTFTLQAP
jgi:large repetitive protein